MMVVKIAYSELTEAVLQAIYWRRVAEASRVDCDGIATVSWDHDASAIPSTILTIQYRRSIAKATILAGILP